jgi:hypothetical protein
MLENLLSMKKYFIGKIQHFLRHVPLPALLDDYTGIFSGRLWWMNQEFSAVDIIPPWFSMLIHHLGDEQYAHCWLKF